MYRIVDSTLKFSFNEFDETISRKNKRAGDLRIAVECCSVYARENPQVESKYSPFPPRSSSGIGWMQPKAPRGPQLALPCTPIPYLSTSLPSLPPFLLLSIQASPVAPLFKGYRPFSSSSVYPCGLFALSYICIHVLFIDTYFMP